MNLRLYEPIMTALHHLARSQYIVCLRLRFQTFMFMTVEFLAWILIVTNKFQSGTVFHFARHVQTDKNSRHYFSITLERQPTSVLIVLFLWRRHLQSNDGWWESNTNNRFEHTCRFHFPLISIKFITNVWFEVSCQSFHCLIFSIVELLW